MCLDGMPGLGEGVGHAGCVSTHLCHLGCLQKMNGITRVGLWSLCWTMAATCRLGQKDGSQ